LSTQSQHRLGGVWRDNLNLIAILACQGFHSIVQDAGDGDINGFLLAENMSCIAMLDVPLKDAEIAWVRIRIGRPWQRS